MDIITFCGFYTFEKKTVRYFIHLAYSGTGYHGWQSQPNAITVQEVVEDGLFRLLRSSISITGAGRTDTGVHARNYYTHFDSEIVYNAIELQQLAYRLNKILPGNILIYRMFQVEDQLHARFSALSRTYRYYISLQKNPFLSEQSWLYTIPLDIGLMEKAAALLITCNDFACFAKSGGQNKTTLCKLVNSRIAVKDGVLVYEVKADRFLRNMVRAIVGTLIEVGKHNMSINDLAELLKSGTRSDAGMSVPAHGLFLEEIEYPKGFDALNINL